MQQAALRLQPTAAPRAAAPTPVTAPAKPRPGMGRDSFQRVSTPAEALEAAKHVLHEKKFNAEVGKNVPSRRIERDAIDSNAWVWGQNKAKAKQLIAANRPLVDARLETLPAAQRAQYAAVAKMVGQIAPAATLALQSLLLAGKLPGATPNKDGQDLLSALNALTLPTTRLADGIDRPQLLRHLIREIAEPAAINQRAWGTCATTSFQMVMAMKDPAELVRIVTGLATPKGAVTLRGGDEVLRVWGTDTARPLVEKADGRTYFVPDERSISTRLFSAAFMDLGNGDDTYDNETDRHVETQGSGLSDGEVTLVVAQALGIQVDTVKFKHERLTPEHPVMDRLRKATDAGMPISAGLDWGAPDENGKVHGGHEVIVTKIEGDKVRILNPWGTEESIDLLPFAERTGALHFPEGT